MTRPLIILISAMVLCLPFLAGFRYGTLQSNQEASAVDNCDSIPELNRQIVEYVSGRIRKKVGWGECWDLAAEALRSVNADWDGRYKYGEKVDWEKDCIYPGDLIQFEGVKIKYKVDGLDYTEKMSHHTAIIYEVKERGSYVLAHQNTGFSGKKVGLSPLEMNNVTGGRYTIYRPKK